MRKAFTRQPFVIKFGALVFTPALVGFDIGLLVAHLV